ncbi:DUF2156 domain-containing protein [Candidatus Saccharibacteria bacterium CPR2]|nr:DUF2156 domain-containing protein [Candidatus Saccharibacteria bacterium CPR2]
MIAKFPKFSKLTLSDRKEIENITKLFPPYSDHNFSSLWAWNVYDSTKLSLLHDNLIIKLTDYENSNDEILTLIGMNKIEETIKICLKSSELKTVGNKIRLIPEETIKQIKDLDFVKIQEDRDNHDYIVPAWPLVELRANEFRGKRSSVNRFCRIYSPHILVERKNMTHLSQADIDSMISVFEQWMLSRNLSENESFIEKRALLRIIKSRNNLSNLYIIKIIVKENVAAFAIVEKCDKDFALLHFEKANILYKGIFHYLNRQVAGLALDLGAKKINFEQDLGIPGLRCSKLTYHPSIFLKKYTISKKT